MEDAPRVRSIAASLCEDTDGRDCSGDRDSEVGFEAGEHLEHTVPALMAQ